MIRWTATLVLWAMLAGCATTVPLSRGEPAKTEVTATETALATTRSPTTGLPKAWNDEKCCA